MQYEHPITEVIWSALVPGKRGKKSFSLSAEGAKAIEAEVRRSIVAGEIIACCEAALIVIGFLSQRSDALEAVCELNRLKKELEPEINAALSRASGKSVEQAETIKTKAAQMRGEKIQQRAEMFGTQPPKGSIKNRDLKPARTISSR